MIVLFGTMTVSEISAGLSSMRSLIGYFDLDPNRVLSLCLDAFECDPDNKAFPIVLTHFKKSYIPQLLGFKLQV
jgi:THO complex subunit 2